MKQKMTIVLALILALTIPAKSKDGVKIGLRKGNKAPEIIEQSIDGDELKLSSLEGKLVLIDFWASWCPPCRAENPTVVKAYENFKNKKFKNGNGFAIFSISLDKRKEAWKKAIEADNLSWEYHVSDLKGWSSKYAIIYGVRGIPANFLIDGNGVIIAKNLRGPALELTLKKLLK